MSYSHAQKNSIKTNAPHKFIWDIFKRYIETKPIKDKWLVPEYRVFHILKNPATHQVDFTLRGECLPNSKKSGLVRYQEPPPFWGPGSKPGTKPKRKVTNEGGESSDSTTVAKVNKIQKIEIELNEGTTTETEHIIDDVKN